jgi:hypothetical protein
MNEKNLITSINDNKKIIIIKKNRRKSNTNHLSRFSKESIGKFYLFNFIKKLIVLNH